MKKGVIYKAAEGSRFYKQLSDLRWKLEGDKVMAATIHDIPYYWRESHYDLKVMDGEIFKGNVVEAEVERK